MTMYDPRSIANLLLDKADSRDISVTNLALQKLIYFAHGMYLTKTKKPLVSGYFEAWQYGPVHPTAYRAFKDSGADPIKIRAYGRDIITGLKKELELPSDIHIHDLIQQVLLSYGNMSAGRLVDLSHAKGAPWAYIVDKARTEVAFGMRIPDSIILERFQYHKVSISPKPRAGEPDSEDAPFA